MGNEYLARKLFLWQLKNRYSSGEAWYIDELIFYLDCHWWCMFFKIEWFCFFGLPCPAKVHSAHRIVNVLHFAKTSEWNALKESNAVVLTKYQTGFLQMRWCCKFLQWLVLRYQIYYSFLVQFAPMHSRRILCNCRHRQSLRLVRNCFFNISSHC